MPKYLNFVNSVINNLSIYTNRDVPPSECPIAITLRFPGCVTSFQGFVTSVVNGNRIGNSSFEN